MVELHYSILVIGWYFSVENVGIPRVDVYYAHRTRVAVCFDDATLFSGISRSVVLIYTVQMYVVLTTQ